MGVVFVRPLNVSLCDETYKLAKQKGNFSGWVRAKLREERNKRAILWRYCTICDTSQQSHQKYCMNRKCSKYLEHETEVLE